jgi:protein tyrosine/serine phosphatase
MRFIRVILGLVIAGIIVAGPYYFYRFRRAQFRNFHVVQEGVLYRSGQMSLDGLQRMVYDHNIKTVMTLRFAADPKNPPPDADEEAYCKRVGLKHVRIPYRCWYPIDGSIPADQGVTTFLKVMRDPSNYPVLIHCFAGIHRTGAYCAVYRMEFDNWSNKKAIAEMKAHGYIEEHPDVMAYLENYQVGQSAQRLADPAIRPAGAKVENRGLRFEDFED